MTPEKSNTNQGENIVAKKTMVIPQTPPTVKSILKVDPDPEQFFDTLIPYLANQILDEWRQEKVDSGNPSAQQKSVERYNSIVSGLEYKYSRSLNITPDELNPITAIKSFFAYDADLSTSTWELYRYSLLHVYNEREQMWREKGYPQESLVTALAALITFSKRPYVEETPEISTRVKSIKLSFFNELTTHLAVDYKPAKKVARHAQSAAIATLATGIRPGEWVDAELRDPFPEEMPDGKDPAGWLAIVIDTSKRKAHEGEWIRTLLIEPGLAQMHIKQHYGSLIDSLSKRSLSGEPGKYHMTRCSTMLKDAAQTLWPKHPERWITLYSLRSQARANIISVYGEYVAAGMMGHAPEKGQRYYSGPSRSNIPRGGRPEGMVPVPGPNCIAKGAEFERHATELRDASSAFSAPSAVTQTSPSA